jgi:hypothetical protein
VNPIAASLALVAVGCVSVPYDARLRAEVRPASAGSDDRVLRYDLVVVSSNDQVRKSGNECDSFSDRVATSIDALLAARRIRGVRVAAGGDVHLVLIHGLSRTELWAGPLEGPGVYRAPANPPAQALAKVLDDMLRDLPP